MESPCNDTEDKSKGASCISSDDVPLLGHERRLDRFSFRHCLFLSFCLVPIFVALTSVFWRSMIRVFGRPSCPFPCFWIVPEFVIFSPSCLCCFLDLFLRRKWNVLSFLLTKALMVSILA